MDFQLVGAYAPSSSAAPTCIECITEDGSSCRVLASLRRRRQGRLPERRAPEAARARARGSLARLAIRGRADHEVTRRLTGAQQLCWKRRCQGIHSCAWQFRFHGWAVRRPPLGLVRYGVSNKR